MIICRYQRSREKQDDIQRETYGDVEPEDRVVVVVSRFLQVGNRRDESRVLQGSGYQGENGNHGYHTIIAWSQQSTSTIPNTKPMTCIAPLFIAPQKRPLAVFSFKVSAI